MEQELAEGTIGDQRTGTVLQSAIFQGNHQLFRWLLSSGANINADCYIKDNEKSLTSPRSDRSSKTGYTKERTIAFAPCGLWPEAGLHSLLEHRAAPNVPNDEDTLMIPPLVSHICRMHVKHVETLLEYAANIHYDGRYGRPLYHSSHLFDKRLEKLLREAGAQDVSTVSY